MEWKKRLLSILIVSLVSTLLQGPALGASLPAYEVRVIARDAYIFTYPLLLHYRALYQQAIDPSATTAAGGFGVFRHDRLPPYERKGAAAPKGDTSFAWAQLDLRAEPWVLTLPATTTFAIASQWNDLWGFVLDTAGTLKDGHAGGSYLLAGPNWQGKLPKGIRRVIRGESSFMGSLTRITGNHEDTEILEGVRQGCTLAPLSAFLGSPPPKPAPTLKWPVWKPKAEKSAECFTYVNFLLPFTTTDERDRPLLNRMAKIGIAPGKPWKPAAMDGASRQAVDQGIADAWKLIRAAEQSTPDGNSLYGSRDQLEGDYLRRTLGVSRGLFGHLAE